MKSNERDYCIKKGKIHNNTTQNGYYKEFTGYLQSKNLIPKSIDRYTQQTERYKRWLLEHRNITPENAEKKELLDYLLYLHEKCNLSGQTRQVILGILRHYYSFLQQTGAVEFNPANRINLRGTKKKVLPKLLTMEEMNELLDYYWLLKVKTASDVRRHIHLRNYIFLSFSVYQGLTRTQIENLTLDDLDLHRATLTIQAGHKSNAKTLSLQASQMGILYDYLENVRPKFGRENGRLINMMPELQKLIITIKKIYPKFTAFKQLRASIITHWIQTEGLRKAQYKAGHRYISSTEEYIANDLESLKDDINRFHPI
jgi:integrase/recombinase XerD